MVSDCLALDPEERRKVEQLAMSHGLRQVPEILICLASSEDVREHYDLPSGFSPLYMWIGKEMVVYSDSYRELLDKTHGHSLTSPMECSEKAVVECIGMLIFDQKYAFLVWLWKLGRSGMALHSRLKYAFASRYLRSHWKEYHPIFSNEPRQDRSVS